MKNSDAILFSYTSVLLLSLYLPFHFLNRTWSQKHNPTMWNLLHIPCVHFCNEQICVATRHFSTLQILQGGQGGLLVVCPLTHG